MHQPPHAYCAAAHICFCMLTVHSRGQRRVPHDCILKERQLGAAGQVTVQHQVGHLSYQNVKADEEKRAVESGNWLNRRCWLKAVTACAKTCSGQN